jgi:hypothetical protein
VLNENFLLCLACWNNGLIEGPCLTLFPNEKIFYGMFHNNFPEGLCVYEMGNECQIYCFFIDGQMTRHMVATFPKINFILDLAINGKEDVSDTQEIEWRTDEEMWALLEKLMKVPIPPNFRKFNKFIESEFVPHFQELEEAYGEDYFFGFKGCGVGMKIGLAD